MKISKLIKTSLVSLALLANSANANIVVNPAAAYRYYQSSSGLNPPILTGQELVRITSNKETQQIEQDKCDKCDKCDKHDKQGYYYLFWFLWVALLCCVGYLFSFVVVRLLM